MFTERQMGCGTLLIVAGMICGLAAGEFSGLLTGIVAAILLAIFGLVSAYHDRVRNWFEWSAELAEVVYVLVDSDEELGDDYIDIPDGIEVVLTPVSTVDTVLSTLISTIPYSILIAAIGYAVMLAFTFYGGYQFSYETWFRPLGIALILTYVASLFGLKDDVPRKASLFLLLIFLVLIVAIEGVQVWVGIFIDVLMDPALRAGG